MGEHHGNLKAQAKAAGQQVVAVSDLGEGVGFAGFEIKPVRPVPGPCDCGAEEGAEHKLECGSIPMVAAALFAVGGPISRFTVKVELRSVMIGEIGRIPLAALKALLTQEEPKAEEETA